MNDQGDGLVAIPSLAAFARVSPTSSPTGIMFLDGSFLVIKEVFRFDCHPDVGDAETPPLHHLHSAGWKRDDEKLAPVPRFTVPEMTLEEVLDLIAISFF